MATVAIFDPAMCCSTGVCGTDVDPTLARFAADVDWLAERGVTVERATLAQEPGKFVANVVVRAALDALGTGALPAIVVDGALKSTGAYPDRAQIAAWVGLDVESSAPRPIAEEPVGVPMLPLAAAPSAARGCCGGAGGC
ncbi:arsenite efflux transporter metallochaperone ArsD [Cellulomonas hominis]